MSGKRYTDEFKIEAVKQVTEPNYKLSDVADHLGVTTKSLHAWVADMIIQATSDKLLIRN
jgi:transposase